MSIIGPEPEEIGDSQPADSDLEAIAALSTTPYGRSLLALANQSALATPLAADPAFTSGFAAGGLFKIAEQTLAAPATSFDFQAIPANYVALHLMASLRGEVAATFVGVVVNVNNDATDANYQFQRLQGSGVVASAVEYQGNAGVRSMGLVPAAAAPAGHFGTMGLEIVGYADTDRHKVMRLNNEMSWATTAATMLVRTGTGIWRNTAAMNRLTLTASSGNWVAGSRVSLYGIKSSFG